jgi:hypothetical protein
MMDWIVTQYELDEEVFVPAGDGEPAQCKRMGDLTLGEHARYAERQRIESEQFTAECEREIAWIDEARRRLEMRGLGPDTPTRMLLTDDEWIEVQMLRAKTKARSDVWDRRQAAIERDIAAGRCFKLLGE